MEIGIVNYILLENMMWLLINCRVLVTRNNNNNNIFD